MTDTLQLIGENTAQAVKGRYFKQRYAEIIKPKPQDNRTAEEIINSFKRKLGGEQT